MALHKNIAEADLHECKGASTATVGKVSIATGAGTSTYRYANPHGSVSFVNYAAPYVLAYPAAYTKLAPTTIASTITTEYTEATTAKLTYTGTTTLDTRILCMISFDHSVASDRDIGFKMYKNGVAIASSERRATSIKDRKQNITMIAALEMATNDYIEVYAINHGVSGDINVYSFELAAMGYYG